MLERAFGLSSTEAELAIRISRGRSPADIASDTGRGIATIRTQLASIFAKTAACRQGELVALVARVSAMP